MTPVKTTPSEVSISKPKSRTAFRSLFKSSSRSSASKTLPLPYTPSEQSTPLPTPSPSRPSSSLSHTTPIRHPIPQSPRKNVEILNPETLPQIPEDFGFFPLHPPLPEIRAGQIYPVDIIALHGINGHHKKTWTHFESPDRTTGVFWLRDFLPAVFPGARIYTYGYNAKLILSRATGNINSFAGTLLEEIMDVRTKREEQRRPIIFICHSMGGLVVKRALTKANLDPKRYGNIKASTTAILFLATPHRGSEDAAFLANIATISNLSLSSTGVSRFKGKFRNDLIKGLRMDDPVVTGIAQDFIPLTDGGIRFYSFIEDLVTVPLNKRVVDDISGRMNVSCEVVIHMAGEDHRSIARYDAVTSPSYEKVLAKLKEAVYDATSPVIKITEEEDGPCLQTFTFPSMLHRKQEVNKSHPKTCNWILKHPNWVTWLNNSNGLLWIKGHPGTGKSTLMAYIHRYLLAQNTFSTIRLDFFFTSRGIPLQKSPLGMYRALLWQIYRQSSVAREMVYKVYLEKMASFGREIWEWQVEELGELLRSMVREVSKKTEVMIFVDALDEAVFENGEKAALALVEYFYSLNDLGLEDAGEGGGVRGVRICISCRHYPVVGSLGPGLEIRVEEENALDLRRFIDDSLRTGIEGWDEEPQNTTNQLVDVISKKGAGVFQWAVLRVPKVIKSINDGEVTFEELQQTIEKESNELFPLYKNIFTNDVSLALRSKSLLFLQWITLSERPLSLSEMRFALACDEQEHPFSQLCCEKEGRFIDSDSRMAKLTKSLSGGLAEVWVHDSVSRVQFIHGTVGDYLRSHGLEMLTSISTEHIAENIIGRTQSRLSRSCLNYLRLTPVQDAITAWLKYEDKIPVFIDYVAKYLFLHASRAEHHGFTQTTIVLFFEAHPDLFIVWRKVCWKLWGARVYSDSKHLIHVAAVFNITSTITYFLEKNVSLETKDEDGHTLLALVAKRGDARMTGMFLGLGAEVNTVNREGTTPLELAAANGHEAIVTMLLEKGAEIKGKGGTSRSALQGAVFGGRLSLVRILIAAGADINTQHEYYGTPLQEAAALRSDDIARLLIESGAEINTPCGRNGSALQAAAFRGHRTLIRVLLEKGADVNFQGGEYGNALQAAAVYGIKHTDIIKLLLDHGAHINAVGGAYGTALQAVLFPGNEDLIQLFLDHGADINIQAGEFGNAIMSAAMSGDEGTVRMLVERGANIHETAGEYGNTLQVAVLSGNGRLVEYFLNMGVDVDTKCGKYGSALQAAVICKPDMVEILLRWQANVNIPGVEYGNPLYAAVALKRKGLVLSLLESGADVNMKVEKHISSLFPTVLQMAASKGDTKVLKQIIEYGANVNAIDGTYGTALKVAATFGHKEIVEVLLDSGADINMNEGFNGTALRAAAIKGHREVVELLIERGTDSTPGDDVLTIISRARGDQRQAPEHY